MNNESIEAPDEAEIERLIDEQIAAYSTLPGITPTVSKRQIIATRKRLKAFPDVCIELQKAEGFDKLLLEHEVKAVKRALGSVAKDPCYFIIQSLYLRRYTLRRVSVMNNVDVSTVKRNEAKLIRKIAVGLYGVGAYDE